MNAIQSLRAKLSLTQAELADLVGTTQAQVQRLERGQRKLTLEWAEKLAPVLKTTARDLMFPIDETAKAPVVGFVGAGMQIYADRETDPEFVDVPPGMKVPLEVVIVRGDSMYPVYRDGDRLIFEAISRPLDEMIGRECVVQLADGRKLVKTLRVSGNEVVLESFNAPLISNIVIEAAWPVKWIERR